MWGAVTPRVLRATAAALAGLAAGSTLVLAHGGDPERIHGCVTSEQTVRIAQDPSDACADANGAPVDWNIRSSAGAPGADGPPGPTGPQGPPGKGGRDGADSRLALRLVAAASRWLPPGTRAVEARCGRREYAVSSAWRVEDPSGIGDFQAIESRPLQGGAGWRVRVDGRYAYRRWRVIVQVACAARGDAP